MATCTLATTLNTSIAGPTYTTASFNPVVGDLIVVFAAVSNTNANPATCTESAGGGTYTQVTNARFASNAHRIYAFVANQLCAATTARTITVVTDGTTDGDGAFVWPVRVSGLTRTGTNAIKQSAIQENQSAGTPAPAFSTNVTSGNPVLGAMMNVTNPAGMTVPSGFDTELSDIGGTSPVRGGHLVKDDTGFTGTTVTWGSASATGYGSVVVELNTAAAATTHSRSAAISATAAIAMDGHAVKSRSAALSATAAVTGAGLHIAPRSAALSASATITSSPGTGIVHRAFDGVGTLQTATANANNLTGAFTAAALIRQTTSGTASFIWLHATSAYTARASMSLSATGLLSVGVDVTTRVAPTLNLVEADGWGIVVVSKAAGTATPRFHVYKGGSWSHENAPGTLADASDHSGGRVLFGSSVLADYELDLAVAGEWDTVLSDGDIETLDGASQNWADLAPLSLWNFDQTVKTDTIPDLADAVDLTGITGVPIGYDGPAGWDFDVVTVTVHERSAALSATAAIASDGLAVKARSAALSATAGIASSGAVTHVHSRSAAITATAAIASAPQRVRIRSAALSATAAIASSGAKLSILSRSAALTATAQIASVPQRVRLRSAALSATGSITSTAVFFSIVERQGALTALATLSASGSRVAVTHSRSAALTATGSIAAAGQRRLHRSASFGASTTLQAAPQRALSRQASLGASGAISSSGEISGAVQRSASFTATASIAASPRRVLSRSAALSATGAVASTGLRIHVRSVVLSASASIAVSGRIAEIFTRSAQILAVAEISATGEVYGPGPPVEDHPDLGGVFDETLTGGIVAVSVNGGTVAESSRGGAVTEPSRGATTPALRSGVVLEPSRGGEPDGDQSGEFYEFLTGGRVAEHVHNGVIANARGAVLHEPTRGGVLTLARSGTAEEPKRGGTFDESLTNGEVL